MGGGPSEGLRVAMKAERHRKYREMMGIEGINIIPRMPSIPENMPPWATEKLMYQFGNYSRLTKAFALMDWYKEIHGMYAFVAWNWVRPLAAWIGEKRCLEVMAGRGYLSYALRECGANLVSTDNMSWHDMRGWRARAQLTGEPLTLTDIESMDCIDAIRKYGAGIDYLIISWAFMDDMSANCVRALREVNPDALIIHIGENSGGCTDSDEFFMAVKRVNDEEFADVAANYETWWGLRDRLRLFKPESVQC